MFIFSSFLHTHTLTAYYDPPFINFPNFMSDNKEVHRYIIDD